MESYVDKPGSLACRQINSVFFRPCGEKQLMKEDPNYSCSKKPERDFSNPISFNLPAAAHSRPIKKHSFDRSRCLETSPNADNEFPLYDENMTSSHDWRWWLERKTAFYTKNLRLHLLDKVQSFINDDTMKLNTLFPFLLLSTNYKHCGIL